MKHKLAQSIDESVKLELRRGDSVKPALSIIEKGIATLLSEKLSENIGWC